MPAVKRASVRAVLAATGMAVLTGFAAPATAATPQATDAKPVVKSEQAQTHKKAKSVKTPTATQLMPMGVNAEQASFVPTAEQKANAEAIIKVGQEMKLPPRAWVIAVATAAQESTLNNLGHLGDQNDHDSLGLFQQRPSAGWGSPDQLTDPEYAARAFYEGLVNVPGWQDMALTDAAQAVQVSAFPYHYAKWEKLAANLVLAKYGKGPLAG
ncbi:hypothetical protein [Catellatospora tritici]|uniref:hypothetical protein n=1 Tax=Catellatospora tritici TaxID=2851566 RepID=UPI001C2D72B0|nr:hypothetical protein [Catellatospora tritici]MBV1855031.1 hypothetical protein [Catellatospora tritici]